MGKFYEATIMKDGKWYIGWIDDMPGVNAQAKTLKELEEDLKEGIILMLQVKEELEEKELKIKRFKKKIKVENLSA